MTLNINLYDFGGQKIMSIRKYLIYKINTRLAGIIRKLIKIGIFLVKYFNSAPIFEPNVFIVVSHDYMHILSN